MIKVFVIVSLAGCLCTALWSQVPERNRQHNSFDIVFSHDFENNRPGEYSDPDWKRDWNNPSWANKDAGYGKIVEENGNKYIREDFPAGTFLLDGSGTQWHVVFDKGYDELYLSFRVKFSSGFSNKNLHGKLPGLSGGKSHGGGYIPNGTDGWSARYMFHGTDINFYLYYPDMHKHFGDSIPKPGKKYYGSGPVLNPGFTLKTDTWYTVTQRIVLNKPGQSNGLVEGYIDGKLCASQTGIRFRDTASLQIDRIFFANFLGGSGVKPAVDEYICFDDFLVFTYKPKVKTTRGHTLNPAGHRLIE